MAEIPYTPDDHGWFPVSRRIVQSSRWVKGSPAAVKLLVYAIEKATNPLNPYPGDIYETGSVLAHNLSLSDEQAAAAVAELCGPDADSQSSKADGAVLEPLTREGRVVGYRLVNFEAHNPGAQERGEAARARRRSEKARAAAARRWAKAKAAAQGLEASDIPDHAVAIMRGVRES